MMESPGGAGRLISVVVGNRRVRRAAPNGFLLRGWRRGTATTARFSSRASNRSGLETLRGILPCIYRNFPVCEVATTTDTVTILLRPRMKLLHRSKGNCRGNRFAGREKFQPRQPTQLRGRADSSKPMKKSILILGAFIGIGLAAVSCRNPNEVSYETSTSAAATGSGGSQVKAKPSAFGSENNPGR